MRVIEAHLTELARLPCQGLNKETILYHREFEAEHIGHGDEQP